MDIVPRKLTLSIGKSICELAIPRNRTSIYELGSDGESEVHHRYMIAAWEISIVFYADEPLPLCFHFSQTNDNYFLMNLSYSRSKTFLA